MTDNPFDLDWPTSGTPDAVSAGRAAMVQWQLLQRDYAAADPVDYIMDVYGDTREQAEAIVKNCHGGEE